MASTSGASLLDRIVSRKREEIQKLQLSEEMPQKPPLDFYEALKNPGGLLRQGESSGSRPRTEYVPLKKGIIAECKKASPSMGLIRPDYDPLEIAQTYARLGASCLSVLTDEAFFQGSLNHLKIAKSAGIPVLRKDFLIDQKQILEARQAGADCILLIVRLLSDHQLSDLMGYSRSLGMEPLVEVHSEEELRRACACGARILGINHRDLDSLEMDLSLSRRLAPILKELNPSALLIAESGIEKPDSLESMSDFADGFLIGTSLMRSPSIEDAWNYLFGASDGR